MKLLIIAALAAFWAGLTHWVWGFYPVTIGGGVMGAIAGALAVALFSDITGQMERDEQPDEMEHLPNDPPVKAEPSQVLCWDGCGKIMASPEVICPQCREKYPWMSRQ